ncbi:MAG: phycobilisome rod-core linker polypeptide, partial [Cyanobacteria bacterium J06628_6]
TPAGQSLRMLRSGTVESTGLKPVEKPSTPRFVELGQANSNRGDRELQQRALQGVSRKRQETKIFKLSAFDQQSVKTVAEAAYRQVFERNIGPYIVKDEFRVLESRLTNREINVKEFVEGIGLSKLYLKEFYAPYPNTKVIELGTKHFLGRAPRDQEEIRKYNQILAKEGIRGFIQAMVNSREYAEYFGEDTVPYRRYPTLPAANFPNTEKLYERLTKQNDEVVIPSFEPAVATNVSIGTQQPLGQPTGRL